MEVFNKNDAAVTNKDGAQWVHAHSDSVYPGPLQLVGKYANEPVKSLTPSSSVTALFASIIVQFSCILNSSERIKNKYTINNYWSIYIYIYIERIQLVKKYRTAMCSYWSSLWEMTHGAIVSLQWLTVLDCDPLLCVLLPVFTRRQGCVVNCHQTLGSCLNDICPSGLWYCENWMTEHLRIWGHVIFESLKSCISFFVDLSVQCTTGRENAWCLLHFWH